MSAKTVLKSVRYAARDFCINRPNRARLKNHDFTLIASDCTGGMMYHDLKERFNSPTINMYIDAPDFIKFISNMDAYLDLPMQEIAQTVEPFPCAKLGDITLHLVHYKSVAEAQQKWNERKTRINRSNIFYIMNDRNGCSQKEIEAFIALPYEHKLLYAAHRYGGGGGTV